MEGGIEGLTMNHLEQSQLSSDANNVEIAVNWDDSDCLGAVKIL
jgi:hypothetical protein